jgi:CubicO group peptidase (beta-lactamase class C family)
MYSSYGMKVLLLYVLSLLIILPFSARVFAQQDKVSGSASIDGIWLGTLHAGTRTLRIEVHLQMNTAGSLTCSLDSIDQKAFGIACGNVVVNGSSVSFDVPAVSGRWSGMLSADGKTLDGTWTQGSSLPLVLERQATQSKPAKDVTAPQLEGVWLGTLHAGTETMRIQLRLQTDSSGAQTCLLDSIDQKAFGIHCRNVAVSANTVSFEVPDVHGSWSGTLSTDGQTLDGTWTQGVSMPLLLARQAKAIEPSSSAPLLDPAMPPVKAEDLKAVLDRDLAEALAKGDLAPATDAGVTIGVVSHGKQQIFTYGVAKPDSVFEIGSITKTFTALLLAQMVEQGKVKLDEPVRELLPAGTVAKPSTAAEITLLDLSDQHSGLPRLPDNLHPTDIKDPYADYSAKLLYAYMSRHGVALPPDAPFGYSNLGVGLLGQALANRAGLNYADLLREQITAPLGMHDTGIALTPEMKTRLIAGHDGQHRPAGEWSLNALAGAGAIRSTAADMLIYLEAQLHPDELPESVLTTPQGKTLPAAISACHVIHAEATPGLHIALNWFRYDSTGSYWHNGATGGYSSYALFNPGKDFALIVLSNTSVAPDAFTDRLGLHIAQRLAGVPAIAMNP